MKYLTFNGGSVWTCLAYMSEQFNLNKSDYQWFGQCGGSFRFVQVEDGCDFDTSLMNLEHINYSISDWGIHLEMVTVNDLDGLMHLLEVCPDWLLFEIDNQWVVIDDNKDNKLFGAWVARYSNQNQPSYRWYNLNMFQRALVFPMNIYRLASGSVTGFKADYSRYLANFDNYYQEVVTNKNQVETVADALKFYKNYVQVFINRFLEINGRFSNDFVDMLKDFQTNHANQVEMDNFLSLLNLYRELLLNYKQGRN